MPDLPARTLTALLVLAPSLTAKQPKGPAIRFCQIVVQQRAPPRPICRFVPVGRVCHLGVGSTGERAMETGDRSGERWVDTGSRF